MIKKVLIKDFEIKSFWYGSRLQGGPEWAYKIVYCAHDGRRIVLDKVCFTKKAAEQYIRETVKITKELLKQREKGK